MQLQKSFIKKTLLSYLAVLLVAIIVAAVSFIGFTDSFEKQSEEYNQVILTQIRDALDDRIHSSNKIIYNIASTPQIKKLSVSKEKLSPQDKFAEIEVMKLLGSYIAIHKFLDTVSVYFPNSSHSITSETLYSSEEQFLNSSSSLGWSKDEWLAVKNKKNFLSFYFTSETMVAVGSMPTNSDALIILTLKASFLSDIASQTLSLEQNQVYVIDNETSEVVLSFGSLAEQKKPANAMPDIANYNQQGYSVTQMESKELGWTYYFILSENPFIQKVQHYLVVTLICILLLGGLVVSVALAYKTSEPIRKLAKSIGENTGINPAEYPNDVAAIDYGIKQIMNDYNTIKEGMTDYLPLMEAKLINSILTGELVLEQASLAELSSILCFPYPYYYIIILSVETGSNEQYSWKNLQLLDYFQHKYTSENEVAYPVETNVKSIGVIVNTSEYNRPAIELQMNTLFTYFHKLSDNEIVLTAAVTSSTDANMLNTAYKNCSKLLDTQLIRLSGVFVFSDSLIPEHNDYYYPLQLETKLVNSVKLGNFKELSALIDTIIVENFFNTRISHQMTLVLFFNLMGTALRVIDTLNYDIVDIFGDEVDWHKKIISCSNVQEMEAVLRETFYTICCYISLQNQKKGSTLIQHITEYITSNISDQSMSLSTVAATFNIHPNYLSSFFKEETKENFLQFLNRLRVTKAEALLLSSDLSINEIATTTGYTTSGVFIRNFKKEYNDTPGNYRTVHQTTDPK